MSHGGNQLQEKEIEPKLLLPNLQGGHFQEHIPGDYSRFNNRLRDYYAVLRHKLGLKLYYWQVRFMFLPKDRKIYDLNFMIHVEKDHDNEPNQLMERFHYYLARLKYGAEIGFIKELDLLEWKMEHSKDVYLQKDHYVKAYKKKWLDNFKEDPEWKLLYHGVDLYELGPHLDKLKIKSSYRRTVYKKAFSDEKAK